MDKVQKVQPTEVLLKYITPQKQKSAKACASFALAHALMLTVFIWDKIKIHIDAEALRREQLRFLMRDDKKSLGVHEAAELLIVEGYHGHKIKPLGRIGNDFISLKRWILKGRPAVIVINNPVKRQTHAVCVCGYGEDFLWVIDSLYSEGYRRFYDFQYIKESYIIFLK